MKNSVFATPASTLEEKLASSLVFDAHSLSEEGLSEEELMVNNILEELPRFFIKGKQTPKTVRFLKELACVALAMTSIPFPFTMVFLLERLTDGGLGMWGGAVILFSGLASLLSSVWLGMFWDKKIKAPKNDKDAVAAHQQLITRAIHLTSSSFLKGRLSELYFLCPSEDIDKGFWKKLVPVLTSFCDTQEGKVNVDQMKSLQALYRKNQQFHVG